ncbi:anthranilate synthase component I [Synechococcus sp. R5-16]|jgi:anthranilate synthase component 1|uniref:anthranilate synthase component I n=1 Tax=unclassified Synechococcus TaxID=2626047 RepID=UPI0039C1DAAC
MIYPPLKEFLALTKQGNFIPVYQEWVADLETPVSAWYRVCAGQPYNFLLESVEGGEQVARYSFLGCDPLWVLEIRGDQALQRYRDGRQEHHQGDPFAILARCLQPYEPVHLPELPSSIGGLFGYWGYELIRWIEPKVPIHPLQPGDPPDAVLMQVDSILLFDQVKRKIWVVAFADTRHHAAEEAYAQACRRVEKLMQQLSAPLSLAHLHLNWKPHLSERTPSRWREQIPPSTLSRPAYCQAVEQAKDYIRAGDIFQVVLSQRFTISFAGDPFRLYRSLRLINPSPYMAFLQFGNLCLIGSSPEVMVKLSRVGEDRIATVRPIAGTRPRGTTPLEDRQLEQELLADPKERAEHVMLVDLARNDLGRVCQLGSVQVDDLMQIERYSHVMHIVSNVVGRLDPQYSAWDLLRATFPAGTVTGAPKIRAMQIIHELEGCRRGPYAGAYGYYDFSGQLNTAITIRTLLVHQGQVSLQAGAGIVADSDPEREYQECLNKARGMLMAVASLQET